MGCCQSNPKLTPLQCPRNFDEAAFQKICRLFDQLDKDSNFGVGIDEVSSVAHLHCNNRIRLIEEKVNALQRDMDAFEKSNNLTMNNEIASCKALFNERFENFRLNIVARQTALRTKQDKYKESDQKSRCKMFVEAVTKPGETNIDFWSFFEYMKTRIDDLDDLTQEASPKNTRRRSTVFFD